MAFRVTRVVVLAVIAAASAAATTFPKPPRGRLGSVPGTCEMTRVFWVGQRLEDGRTHRAIPDSGSSITLANGVAGVDYAQVPAVNRSHVGDPVKTCLISLPKRCPPGDDRGKIYTTTNLRTREHWTLPDAEHMCGGA